MRVLRSHYIRVHVTLWGDSPLRGITGYTACLGSATVLFGPHCLCSGITLAAKSMRTSLLSCLLLAVSALATAGCEATKPPIPIAGGDARNAPSYGYTPLDPLPVRIAPIPEAMRSERNRLILESLPDETIRIATGRVSGSGNVTFGPAQIGVEGSSYVVIIDYVKYNTSSFAVTIGQDSVATLLAPGSATNPDAVIPVYMGVGLRLTATIRVREGTVDLGNLFAIGAAAQANQVSGTLVVQTLGITGEGISGLIPVPGRIDDSTIQNAIVALGSIKAKLYEDDTQLSPRIVALYNTIGGGEGTINGFISNLVTTPPFHLLPGLPMQTNQ